MIFFLGLTKVPFGDLFFLGFLSKSFLLVPGAFIVGDFVDGFSVDSKCPNLAIKVTEVLWSFNRQLLTKTKDCPIKRVPVFIGFYSFFWVFWVV